MTAVVTRSIATPLLVAGTDLDVVNGARCSTASEHPALTPADEGLIRRLVADGHTEPLRGVWAKFRLTCSIKAARQIMTHKRYLAVNERSTRYVAFVDSFILPPVRGQVGKLMDYAYVELEPAARYRATGTIEAAYQTAYLAYENLLADGVSKEDAAYVLPLGVETVLIASGDLVGWLRFLSRRTYRTAQHETRQLAQAIETALTEACPITMHAWDQEGRRAL
jgi:thymidylate synthase (FAD)